MVHKRTLACLFFFLPFAVFAQKKTDKPNIVVIMADDLGYGDLGSFGATDIRTPNIDGLANQGIKLTSFYSASPVCSPTRFGLLTGRLPRRAGIDHVFFPESYTGIPHEETTIAEALKGVGYATGIVGKWHLGHQKEFLPLQHGFDEYYGMPYSNDMQGVVYIKGNEVDSLKVNQRYTTKTYTWEAVSFIDRHKDQPFFLYLAHTMPHVPLYASPAFEGKSKRGLYGDVVEELDWSVGEVLNALKKNGVEQNTVVIFTSDNGPWLVFDVEGGSAGPFRQGKGTTFEGGQRVPGIVYWHGRIPAGSVYSDLTTQLDLYPTLIGLTGSQKTETHHHLDGEDIMPVLFGIGSRMGNEFPYYMDGKLEAFRKGDWKIRLPHAEVKQFGMVTLEATDTLLFHLKSDPGEKRNVLKSYPDKAKELLAAMENFNKKLSDTPPTMMQRMPADDSHIKKLMQRHPEAKTQGK